MDFAVIPKKKRVSAVGTAASKKNPSTTQKSIKAKPQAPSSKASGKKVVQVTEQEMMEVDGEEWENAHEGDLSEGFNFVGEDEEEAMDQRFDEDG